MPEGGEDASGQKKDLKLSFAKPVEDFEDNLTPGEANVTSDVP